MRSKLPPAITTVLREGFAGARLARAQRIVERAAANVPDRVLAEIIGSSEGDLGWLRGDLKAAEVDWRDALMAGATRRLRQSLTDALGRAGVPVGRARRAVIEALTWTPGLWFDGAELEMRVRGRASRATIQHVVQVLANARWLHVEAQGRIIVYWRRRRRR